MNKYPCIEYPIITEYSFSDRIVCRHNDIGGWSLSTIAKHSDTDLWWSGQKWDFEPLKRKKFPTMEDAWFEFTAKNIQPI